MTERSGRLGGRTAIVTGGSRGLGKVMAAALLAEGASVVVTSSRNQDELDATVEELGRDAPGRVRGQLADVGDWQACEKLVAATVNAFGGVDILINNAARGAYELAPDGRGREIDFWDADPEVFGSMVRINLAGPFFMTRASVPHMRQAGYGRIVNISTSRPTMVLNGIGAYGASKAGLETLTRLWSEELAGSGITVNVLAPGGATDTAILPGKVGERADPDFRPGTDGGGEGRRGTFLPPWIMGPPAVWLASPASEDWTGRRIIAANWNPDIEPRQAAEQSATEPAGTPAIL